MQKAQSMRESSTSWEHAARLIFIFFKREVQFLKRGYTLPDSSMRLNVAPY